MLNIDNNNHKQLNRNIEDKPRNVLSFRKSDPTPFSGPSVPQVKSLADISNKVTFLVLLRFLTYKSFLKLNRCHGFQFSPITVGSLWLFTKHIWQSVSTPT